MEAAFNHQRVNTACFEVTFHYYVDSVEICRSEMMQVCKYIKNKSLSRIHVEQLSLYHIYVYDGF